ncbi:NADAR family protein [Glycomyces salinus]|uniref:NADAR family protein n=1 Tax=Glycomyces salinus TaxID=980294 RepID=UPI0035583007
MLSSAAMPRNVDDAVALERKGSACKHLYFWGQQPETDGGVGRGCLSQWWPSVFIEDGRSFASAEHYMMAHKAWLFGDDECAETIRAASHPGEAKRLGRTVRGFDQERWNEERFGIVVRGNLAKFDQDPGLRTYLLGTRERVLVEASPVDRTWGIGLTADDPRAAEPSKWRGPNLLGFALMAARRELDS